MNIRRKAFLVINEPHTYLQILIHIISIGIIVLLIISGITIGVILGLKKIILFTESRVIFQSSSTIVINRFLEFNELPYFANVNQTLNEFIKEMDEALYAEFGNKFIKSQTKIFSLQPNLTYNDDQQNSSKKLLLKSKKLLKRSYALENTTTPMLDEDFSTNSPIDEYEHLPSTDFRSPAMTSSTTITTTTTTTTTTSPFSTRISKASQINIATTSTTSKYTSTNPPEDNDVSSDPLEDTTTKFSFDKGLLNDTIEKNSSINCTKPENDMNECINQILPSLNCITIKNNSINCNNSIIINNNCTDLFNGNYSSSLYPNITINIFNNSNSTINECHNIKTNQTHRSSIIYSQTTIYFLLDKGDIITSNQILNAFKSFKPFITLYTKCHETSSFQSFFNSTLSKIEQPTRKDIDLQYLKNQSSISNELQYTINIAPQPPDDAFYTPSQILSRTLSTFMNNCISIFL